MGAIIAAVIVGAIIGALARLVMPGKQDISILMTVILGIIGGLAGSWIWHALGGSDTKGIDWIALIIGIICAAVLIGIYTSITGRKQVTR
jgi:uncharacterized membrane protein YeaQ/YmgE (transglycosylase-associated protein family)